MKQSESEILSILDAHKDAPMVNPNKVYPPLPPAENITPLVRIPKEMCFTKKSAARNTSSTPISVRAGVTC